MAEEDLVQEVFLKMFARLDRYHPMDGIPFDHWLSRLAVRTCLDALRWERTRPLGRTVTLSDGVMSWLEALQEPKAAAVDDALAARELLDMLLSGLEARDRLLLTLLDLEERSVADVAAMTGNSETLVKVRAFRARRRLRARAEVLLAESREKRQARGMA